MTTSENELGYLVNSRGQRVFLNEAGEEVPRTWKSLVDGRLPISELDDEELKRAQLKSARGQFDGPAGRLIPRDLSDARTRETMQRVKEQFQQMALDATKVFTDVLNDDEASWSDKMKAAEYLHQRFLGKVPDKVELTAEVKPWEGLVNGGILRDLPGAEGASAE